MMKGSEEIQGALPKLICFGEQECTDVERLLEATVPIEELQLGSHQILTIESLSKFGRPLWHQAFRQVRRIESHSQEKNSWHQVIRLAWIKMNHGSEMSRSPDFFLKAARSSSSTKLEDGLTMALALICSRIPIDVFSSDLSSELVAGWMATCFHISNDRTKILAKYPSEPILAEGSARFWSWSDQMLNGILQAFCAIRRIEAINL
jgi:hypothetical protein